jgi:hypothetical protein
LDSAIRAGAKKLHGLVSVLQVPKGTKYGLSFRRKIRVRAAQENNHGIRHITNFPDGVRIAILRRVAHPAVVHESALALNQPFAFTVARSTFRQCRLMVEWLFLPGIVPQISQPTSRWAPGFYLLARTGSADKEAYSLAPKTRCAFGVSS